MNPRDAKYYADTKVKMRGGQLFFVNPNFTNEGGVQPVPGSIRNYPYRLPFTQHNFPVRSIRVYNEGGIVGPTLANPHQVLLTLRKADGTYLLRDVPASTFIQSVINRVPNRPILFRGDFFPDPKQCSARWTTTGVLGLLAIQFNYG